MEHKQVKEVLARNGSGTLFSAFGVPIPEGDHAVLAMQDIFFSDDTPIQVPTKIDHSLLAVARVLTVNHPLFGAFMGNRQLIFHQGLEQFGPEDLGQCLVAEEIFAGFLFPQPGFEVDACSGHDHMNVGMIIQSSALGMKDSGEPR